MYAIISNDWKALNYSEAFMKEYIRRAEEWLNAEPGRSMAAENGSYDWRMASDLEEAGLKEIRLAPDVSDEIKAKLLIEMQENSFKELLNGATVFEYDETEVHPVIYEEEYGGQSIEFEYKPTESGTPDYVPVMTYDPTGKHDVTNKGNNYDASTDSYNGTRDYSKVDPAYVKEFVIKGSRQAAKELVSALPEEEKEVFKEYMRYADASLKDVKNMISLKPEYRENYYHLWKFNPAGRLSGEKLLQYAPMWDKELSKEISTLVQWASGKCLSLDMCIKTWDKVRESGMLQDFIGGNQLYFAINAFRAPELFKYVPLIKNGSGMDSIRSLAEEIATKAVENNDIETVEKLVKTLAWAGMDVPSVLMHKQDKAQEDRDRNDNIEI